jgi:sec-independent protein translocase protein TatB
VPLNLSFTHIMVVLIVALIVLGPDKLPDAARTLARWVGEFRRMSAGLHAEVRDTFGDLAEPFSDLVNTVSGGVSDFMAPPSAPEPPASAAGGAALAALPSLGPTSGPVSPGPSLTAHQSPPINGLAPLDGLAPLGGAPPAIGTFAAFPGNTLARTDVSTPPSTDATTEAATDATTAAVTDATEAGTPLPRNTNGALPPGPTAGPSSNDAVGVETTG